MSCQGNLIECEFANYKWRTKGCFASKYFGIYELHFFGAGFVKKTLFFRSEMVGISHFFCAGDFFEFCFWNRRFLSHLLSYTIFRKVNKIKKNCQLFTKIYSYINKNNKYDVEQSKKFKENSDEEN